MNVLKSNATFVLGGTKLIPVNPMNFFLISRLTPPIFSQDKIYTITYCLRNFEKTHRISWDSLCHGLD